MMGGNQHQHGVSGSQETVPETASAKKPFVEPTVSSPVDVLEATTFFAQIDTGGTGDRKKGGGLDPES